MPPAVASIFSLLLIITGAAKLRRPDETARSLREIGIPFARPLTLVLAGAEILVGATALATGHQVALLAQALMYSVFLAWVLIALRLDVPMATCGCLGRDDTPPYWGHVLLNSFAVAGSGATALLMASVSLEGLAGLADVAIVLVGAGLAWALLDQGARAHGLVQP